jgi:AcrR family transcriptional regulator
VLLRAAGEQFAAAGYHGAALETILDRAGVTKGSLYFHFRNKAALAEAVLAEMASRKLRAAQRMRGLGLDPLTCLIAELDAITELDRENPVVRGGNRLLNDPLIPTSAASQNDYQFAQGQIAAQLTSAQAAGLLRPVVRPTRLARTLVALITGHRLMCERTHTPHEMPQVIAEMWEVVVPLIATERWLRHLDPSSLDPAVPRRSLAAVAAVRDAATHERTQQ